MRRLITRWRDLVDDVRYLSSVYRMIRTRRRLGESWSTAFDRVTASEIDRLARELRELRLRALGKHL